MLARYERAVSPDLGPERARSGGRAGSTRACSQPPKRAT